MVNFIKREETHNKELRRQEISSSTFTTETALGIFIFFLMLIFKDVQCYFLQRESVYANSKSLIVYLKRFSLILNFV